MVDTATLIARARDPMLLAARIFVALLFVPEGWDKVMDFKGTTDYIASQHLPLPTVAAALAIVAEVGCGALLVLGCKARLAALGLALFVAVLTPLFHPFWTYDEARRGLQELMFFKNLALLGGLRSLAVAGPGRWSVDRA